MGNCVEKAGTQGLIDAILAHPSNQSRDSHTVRALHVALKGKGASDLKKILDGLDAGDKLPDTFH